MNLSKTLYIPSALGESGGRVLSERAYKSVLLV